MTKLPDRRDKANTKQARIEYAKRQAMSLGIAADTDNGAQNAGLPVFKERDTPFLQITWVREYRKLKGVKFTTSDCVQRFNELLFEGVIIEAAKVGGLPPYSVKSYKYK